MNPHNLFARLHLTGLLFACLLVSHGAAECQARKIKQTHTIETSSKRGRENGTKKVKTHRIYASDTVSAALITADTSITRITSGDSLTRDSDSLLLKQQITFSGYDKPATSNKETFHITNFSPATIKKAGIRVTYLDLKDRMLHSREAIVNCVIPPDETRLASIPTWDVQHTFYYVLGPEPKRAASPYKVKIELLWIEI